MSDSTSESFVDLRFKEKAHTSTWESERNQMWMMLIDNAKIRTFRIARVFDMQGEETNSFFICPMVDSIGFKKNTLSAT